MRLAQNRLFGLVIVTALSFSNGASVSNQKSDPGPIRVGIYLDLSGPTAAFGRSTLNGVKMAAEEINKAGGISGRRVELIVEDDLGRSTEVSKSIERLIVSTKVDALLGDVTSTNSLVGARIAQAAKVPMITLGTHPSITQVGDYIFRVSFIDSFQGEAMAEFAVKTLKARRVALFDDATSDYSQSLATAFEKRLRRLGGQLVARRSYTHGETDFKTQLGEIKAFRPDVVFVPGYFSEAGIISKQAKQVGLNVPLLGGDGWESNEIWKLGGTSLNGAFISHHYSSGSPLPANKVFVIEYKKLYEGLEPDALAAFGFDGLRMLADAIGRAGSTNGPALRDALAATKNFSGVTGGITLDKNRDAIKAAVILRLKDGRFEYLKTVGPD